MCAYILWIGQRFAERCCRAVIYACTVHILRIALQAIGFQYIGKEHDNKAHESKCFKFKQAPADDL